MNPIFLSIITAFLSLPALTGFSQAAKGQQGEIKPDQTDRLAGFLQAVEASELFDSAQNCQDLKNRLDNSKFKALLDLKNCEKARNFQRYAQQIEENLISHLATDFLQALEAGDVDTVEDFLNEREQAVALRFRGGKTPVHIAAQNYHLKLLEMLLDDYNADPDAQNDFGWTALHYAAYDQYYIDRQKNRELMDILHENDADPNIQDNQGWTPLHLAVYISTEQNNVDFDYDSQFPIVHPSAAPNFEIALNMFYFFEDEIKINAKDDRGVTAYMLAAQASNPYQPALTLRFLLFKGANPNMQDIYGQTALHHIAIGNHPLLQVAAFFESRREALQATSISQGWDIFNGPEGRQHTAMQAKSIMMRDLWALFPNKRKFRDYPYLPFATVLIHSNCYDKDSKQLSIDNCHWKDHQGRSPIDLALQHRSYNTVELLNWAQGGGYYSTKAKVKLIEFWDLLGDWADDIEDWWEDDVEDWIDDFQDWRADRAL